MSHLGEPCIHCGATLETMQPGPCEKSTGLAATMREVIYLDALLAKHKQDAERKTKQLEGDVAARRTVLNQVEAGLDPEKITLAETVIYASDYSRGGQDRGSARGDAIKWLATGKPVDGNVYKDLRQSYFGTKNYDRWSGQREDHEYGMGPRHGSTVFKIGLRKEARNRDLTDAEREAAIYYLINLERVQAARAASAAS